MTVRPRREYVTLEADAIADAVTLGRLEALLEARGVPASVSIEGDGTRATLRLPYPEGRNKAEKGERPGNATLPTIDPRSSSDVRLLDAAHAGSV